MILNIYYSKQFPQKSEFEKFFIDNYLFKEKEDYLAGELLDIYFYDIDNYAKREGIDIVLVDESFVSEYLAKESIQKIVDNKMQQKWEDNNKSVLFIILSKNGVKLEIAHKINLIRADKVTNNLFEFLLSQYASKNYAL